MEEEEEEGEGGDADDDGDTDDEGEGGDDKEVDEQAAGWSRMPSVFMRLNQLRACCTSPLSAKASITAV